MSEIVFEALYYINSAFPTDILFRDCTQILQSLSFQKFLFNGNLEVKNCISLERYHLELWSWTLVIPRFVVIGGFFFHDFAIHWKAQGRLVLPVSQKTMAIEQHTIPKLFVISLSASLFIIWVSNIFEILTSCALRPTNSCCRSSAAMWTINKSPVLICLSSA